QAFTDLFAHGVVLLRTKQPNLPAVAYLLVRYRSVVLRRPALGLAELGAWAQHQDRSVELEPKPLYRGVPAGRVDLQTRTGIGARQLIAGLKGQRHEALDHQRVAVLVQHPDIVEQPVAHFAAPAGALGDAGEERHQGGLEGVGQQDGLIVPAAQLLADAPAGGDVQHAVAEGEAQCLTDLGHALENRSAPFGGQYIDLAIGAMAQLQAGKQCLCHDHVAHPAGADNQHFHQVTLFPVVSCTGVLRTLSPRGRGSYRGVPYSCGEPWPYPTGRGPPVSATYLTRVSHSP